MASQVPDSRVALLGRILGVLGVSSLAACAGRTTTDSGEEAADGTDSESESSSESGESGTSTGEEDDSSDGPIFDLKPGDGDGDTATDTDAECSDLKVDGQIEFNPPPQCLPDDGSWYSWSNVCFYLEDGQSCDSEPFADACILAEYNCGLIEGGEEIGCGPITTETGACCYVVWGDCAVGRPWIVDGRVRRATLELAEGWSGTMPVGFTADVDACTRAALADIWANEGLTEHASVASFARFTTQLLALGAPSELVSASIRAQLDEVRHAEACFELARRYAAGPVSHGPGALDVTRGLDEPLDPESIAISLASEGCIAETVSAILLAAARDRARDPVVRAALTIIVEDELEHVLLAWQALAWMCRASDSTGWLAKLAALFEAAEQHVGFGATTELAGDPAIMRAHGVLSIDERRAVATRALTDVVGPAARELLGSTRMAARRRGAARRHEAALAIVRTRIEEL